MGLVKLDLHPSSDKLRDFGDVGLCMCVLLALLGNALLGWELGVIRALALAGLALYLLSRCSTRLILPVYQALMLVSFPIGWVIGHLVLGLVYYVVVSGLALVFRLIGRDALHRQYDPGAASYWVPCPGRKKPSRYFQQF